MSGYSLWVWWYSLINSGLFGGFFGATTGAVCGVVTGVTFVVDPVAGTMLVNGTVAVPSAVSAMLVRATRPCAPGRNPTVNMLRNIAFVTPGVETDVAADYIAMFGSFPVSGSRVLLDIRYASADDRCASLPVRETAVVGGAVSCDEVLFEPASQEIPVMGSTFSTATPLFCDYFGDVFVEVLNPDEGFFLTSSSIVQNDMPDFLQLQDYDQTPRTVNVTCRYSDNLDPARYVDITFEVIVFPV